MKYQQLTQEQRYQIGACLKIGMNKSQVAREIKVHRSTITRELRCNNEGGRYRPAWAIKLARERQQSKRKHRIDEVTWGRVDALLKLGWSPQQILAPK